MRDHYPVGSKVFQINSVEMGYSVTKILRLLLENQHYRWSKTAETVSVEFYSSVEASKSFHHQSLLNCFQNTYRHLLNSRGL
jgi:hypothetical protein